MGAKIAKVVKEDSPSAAPPGPEVSPRKPAGEDSSLENKMAARAKVMSMPGLSGDMPGMSGDNKMDQMFTDYLDKSPYTYSKGDLKDAKVQTVNWDDLCGTRCNIKRKRLLAKINQAGTPSDDFLDDKSTPIVVKYKGKQYVDNGHHRITASHLLGGTSFPARVIDLDAKTEGKQQKLATIIGGTYGDSTTNG